MIVFIVTKSLLMEHECDFGWSIFIVSAIGVYVILLLWHWWIFYRNKNEEITLKHAMNKKNECCAMKRIAGIFNVDKWIANRRQRCKKHPCRRNRNHKAIGDCYNGWTEAIFPTFLSSKKKKKLEIHHFILYNCIL